MKTSLRCAVLAIRSLMNAFEKFVEFQVVAGHVVGIPFVVFQKLLKKISSVDTNHHMMAAGVNEFMIGISLKQSLPCQDPVLCR